MRKLGIVFPSQLFAASPILSETQDVILIEHPRFFSDFRFHKKKLILHRASMKAYAQGLTKKGCQVRYVELAEFVAGGGFPGLLSSGGGDHLYVVDPCDVVLTDTLNRLAETRPCTLHLLESPQFMAETRDSSALLQGQERFSMARFYAAQRKRMGILMEDGKPLGGKWSFDAHNRRSLPREVAIPKLPRASVSEHVKEARQYVLSRFPGNPGSPEGFFYPVTHREARRWLKRFLERRLVLFGPYEDAISKSASFLFHSLLSPLLNIGLLTPTGVVVQTLKFSESRDVPLNSLEGFIRQIIGWREFVRAVYSRVGPQMRSANFWNCNNALPASFYTARTSMEPVDVVIRRVCDHAFAHHIERLMVLGNFMLLCEIHPDHVYRWFMELFIDAYDWVMVPNVYGMSQYADGGRITTKPYVSSSNYVRKMSDFPAGAWCDVWDALFWRFIHKHRSILADNPRMGVMIRQVERMDEGKLRGHIDLAERYLATLFRR